MKSMIVMISTCNAYKHVFKKKKNYGQWLFIDDLCTKNNLDLLIRNLPNMEKRFPMAMDSPVDFPKKSSAKPG